MDIEIDFEKSLEENASSYFEKSKAAKKKLTGLKKAMIDLEKKSLKVKEKPKAKPLARVILRQIPRPVTVRCEEFRVDYCFITFTIL